MSSPDRDKNTIVILGGGLAGLSAGYVLSKAGRRVTVFENNSTVGGLAKTVVRGEFRFDLGGHRFFTKNERIERFVKDLLNEELIVVPRKSKIYLHNKYFDYPLKPVNAIMGLGIPTTLKIISDYGIERVKNLIRPRNNISLEDWVISNFGLTMFNLYFKEYSEKVWGTECSRISMEWVAQRIVGLSLGKAIKTAFLKFSGKGIPTLAENFLYPSLGIGRVSEKLKDEIEKDNTVFTDTNIVQLNRRHFRIESVIAKNCDYMRIVKGGDFISSIPLTSLIKMLHPRAPDNVLEAVSMLRYRDLAIVAIMLKRERVTDQTWIYIPERQIPFSRIHEPKNWSMRMASENKTLIVAEHFCFEGDETWRIDDKKLTESTIHHLDNLGYINRNEVIDSAIIRVPKAYPLLEVGYRKHYSKVLDYLNRFKNLHIAGRGGMFKYYNMDHAMESGIEAAERIIKSN